jgi:hypothetical protein
VTVLVIHLNDSAIGVGLGGETVLIEPGYALRVGDELVLGQAAQAQARVNPQAVSNRYWDTLDQTTLRSDGDWRQTPAEIAYAQLAGIWARCRDRADAVMLAVPATFSTAQLGLILGMCREAGIPVVSIIDSAVAALATVPAPGPVVHLDITLHRVIATRCMSDGTRLVRERTAELDQLGSASVESKWAATVADLCVRTTRFDPMHSAASEQQLYAALPGMLQQLRESDSAVYLVQLGDDEHQVTVPIDAFARATRPFYRQIGALAEEVAGGDPVMLVLSSRLAAFPQLRDTLAGMRDWPVSVLEPGAALRGVDQDLPAFMQSPDAVGLITERPVHALAAREDVATRTVQADAASAPTHVLVDGAIYALDANPFVVGSATPEGSWGYRAGGAVKGVSRRHCSLLLADGRASVRDHSTYGTLVNGERIDGECRLVDGDVIRVGNPGVELRLVRERVFDGA